MNNYVIAGWTVMIVGIVIEGLILALTVNACITSTYGFPFREPFSWSRCYITIESVYVASLFRYPNVLIVIGIAIIITGIVLRSRGRKKEKKIS